MASPAKLRMIQIVLLRAWDPIGVRSIPEAADEYDSYAPVVLQMLETGASDRHIADYLTSVVRDQMGLGLNPKADEDITVLLRELYTMEA